jgi:tetratricopeptide (TPR) repeat protein
MDPKEELIAKAQALNKEEKYLEEFELLTDTVLESYHSADLYAEKALAYYRIKKYEQCNDASDKALSIDPKHPKANNYKGNLCNYYGEYEKAIGFLNIAIETDPKYAAPYSNLGNTYNALKEYEKAIGYYNKAIEIDPKSPYPYNGLGNTYFYLIEYDKAIGYYNKAIETDPKFAAPYDGLGNTFYALKEYEKAIGYYNKAIEIDPKSAYYYNSLGNTYKNFKEYEKAIGYYNKAIEIDPKFAYPYIGMGNTYYELNEYEKAIWYFNKVIEIDPKSAYPYNNLGNTFYDLKEHEKAIGYYNKAIEIDPKYADPFDNLGKIYNDLKEYEKAIMFFNKAIEINPKSAYSYNALGNTYIDLKEYEKAIGYFNKAIEIDPKYADPFDNLGKIYNDLKEYEKAIGYYNKAIEIDPKSPYPYNGLGNTYIDLKDYEKAIGFFSKAIEINPKFAAPYYNLGKLSFEHKEYEKSLEHLEKFIALTKFKPDYFLSIADSIIIELKKLIKNVDYSNLTELVTKIKELLCIKRVGITHYTSLSVAKNLIIDGSLFRLSEGAYLNDTSEGRELYKFLPYFPFSKKDDDTIAELFVQKPFIGSFVTDIKHNDLTLWRMYGKEAKEEAKGCAITIDMDKLLKSIKDKLIPDMRNNTSSKSDDEFEFYRVAYRKQGEKVQFLVPGIARKQEKELNTIMENLSINVKNFVAKKGKNTSEMKNLFTLLNEITYLFKSAEYQHENELRLVIKGIGFDKNINTEYSPPKVYIELVTVRPLITKITLGPKVEKAEEWAAAFYYSLNKDGFNPDIHISHLPFK